MSIAEAVYFGTDVFLGVFEYLQKNHNILALYTYHNEEDYFTERGVVQLAHMSHIPVHYELITDDVMEKLIRDEGCDLFFVAEYSSMIPTLAYEPSFRAVNIHSSFLPEGRSYYPIEVVIDKGMRESGVTMHKIAPQLDHGDIIIQRKYEILPEDDSVDIYLKCGRAAREMTQLVMENFDGYWRAASPQIEKLPYWKRPNEADMTITHEMTVAQAAEVYRRFNRMTKVNIDSLAYFVDGFMTGNTPIGRTDKDVIIVSDKRIIYGLADGNIRIDICPVDRS